MLEVRNLQFDYIEKPLLDAVTFQVNEGGLLHICGANGVGKTTLLKLIAGLLQPAQGDIFYDGKNTQQEKNYFRQNICYVGHKSGVSPMLTVQEHYQFELQHLSNQLSFDAFIDLFSLTGLEHTLCGLLSAGQRRRMGLSRLFFTNASLWLLDEPLVALDQQGIDLLMDRFNQHLTTGGLIILTSHQKIPIKAQDHQAYYL